MLHGFHRFALSISVQTSQCDSLYVVLTLGVRAGSLINVVPQGPKQFQTSRGV